MNDADSPKPKVTKKSAKKSAKAHDFLIVGIGASAGGIRALSEFFAAIPADCGMAFVIILHLSQDFKNNLAAILQTQTVMTVMQITKTVKVEPNNVYIIPPARPLRLVNGVIEFVGSERIACNRVPIDLFFGSLSEAYDSKTITVLLSGTGSDGATYIKRVKEYGGIVIVQDPQNAEFDGMPRNNSSCAENTLVNRLEGDLMRIKDRLRTTIEQYETSIEELKASNEELQGINKELRAATEELETGKNYSRSMKNYQPSTTN